MKFSTKLKISAGALALAAVTATSAQALTDTFNVDVTFTEPFTITETTPGNLGELAAINGSYTQAALTGVVTPTTAGAGVVNAATATQAEITLTETAGTADVDITVDNQQAGINGYLTIDGFDCSYNAAALTGATCAYDAVANPAAGSVLSIGFNVTVGGNPPDAATDQADYDVTILFD